MPHPLTQHLENDGVVALPSLIAPETLALMQRVFDVRLNQQSWNDVRGYEKTELHRHMIQDILTLDKGFVEVALHPVVKEILRDYMGDTFALVEAKGWLSLPTKRDFHGWHGDAWYDQKKVSYIPREVKLGFYLTDVKSGAFQYIKGSHAQKAPRTFSAQEANSYPAEQIAEMTGPAGTAFLFDTSGIHRQAVPILEPRRAFFLNYHDPKVPLQEEDIAYDRYHPLLLNAAFLGGLSTEDTRILGFGETTNYIPAYQPQRGHRRFHSTVRAVYNVKLRWEELQGRITGRLRRMFARRS
jgi:Phytanoyl-CoA dioxygenase (PhyH)